MKYGRYGRSIDRKGNVSFAMIAILLILLSIISVAYISKIDRINYENKLEKERISAMEVNLDKVFSDIKSRINYMARWSTYETGGNNTALQDLFNKRLDNYIDNKIDQGGWKIGKDKVLTRKDEYKINISKKKKSVSDIKKKVSISNKVEFSSIKNNMPGKIGLVNQSFLYELNGYIVLQIKNKKDNLDMNKNRSIEMEIDVPYPFFDRKLDSFQSSISGKSSDVGRMMKYILNTLAQYRVLRGYGMKDKYPTNRILTKNDVETALNLALILEMCYKFKSHDPENIEAFKNNSSSPNSERIRGLIENYTDKGIIDASDIVSMFYGYGYDTEIIDEEDSKPIDTAAVIAQSINGILDQFIIKYLEYFGLDLWGEFAFKGIQFLDELVDKVKKAGKSFLDFITGNEKDKVTDQQIKSVKNWVKKIFVRAGLGSTNLIRKNYTLYNNYKDKKINDYPKLPEKSGLSYILRFKAKYTSDKHKWFEYNCSHDNIHKGRRDDTCDKQTKIEMNDGSVRNLRCGAQEILAGYDYLKGKARISFENSPIIFKPQDILDADRDIWKKLFKDFEEIVNEDYLKDDLKNTLENIISDISENIMSTMGNNSLNRYRYIKVDPGDRKSVLTSVKNEVIQAVHDTVSYYRKNPSNISNIVKDHQKENERIIKLKDWLKENYDDLVDKEEYLEEVINKTAHFLADKDNKFLKIENEETDIIQGEINEPVDFTVDSSPNIDKKEILFIAKNGGVRTDSKINEIKNSINKDDEISKSYKKIKKREIGEQENGEFHSKDDGIIIQALDAYQYGGMRHEYKSTDRKAFQNKLTSENVISEKGKEVEKSIINKTRKKETYSNLSTELNDNKEEKDLIKEKNTKLKQKKLASCSKGNSFKLNSLGYEKIKSKHVVEFNYSPLFPSTMDTVTFTDLNKDNSSIANRTWSIEGCGTYYGSEFEYNFSDDGFYNVTLNITDKNGNMKQASKRIYINNTSPLVRLKIDPEIRLKTDQNITFDQTSRDIDGKIEKILWDFGDGNTSNKDCLNHSYAYEGTYGLVLKVWDDDGSCTAINKTIHIENRLPHAHFDSSSSIITECEPVSFQDKSLDHDGEIVNRTWNFGDGSYAYEKNTSHIFDAPGNYTVKLTVIDNDGLTNTTSKEILVDDAPFIEEVSPNTSYSWDVYQKIKITFSEDVDRSSIKYSIKPSIKFNITWIGKREVIFRPVSTYERSVDYALNISDVIDKDKGINSSLINDNTINWKTEEFASVKSYYPFKSGNKLKNIAKGRPILLVFSEPVKNDIDIDSLIECNVDYPDWSYSLNHNMDVMKLYHSSFRFGKNIDLRFHLEEIRTKSDNTILTKGGHTESTLLEIKFKTKERITHPGIIESNYYDESTGEKRLKFVFDTVMDKSSFSYSIFPSVRSGKVKKVWNRDKTELNIQFDSLKEGIKYKIYIDIADEKGRHLDSERIPFSFKTRDITCPRVESFSHHDGSAGVLSHAPLKISFSESMDPNEFDYYCDPYIDNWKEIWGYKNKSLYLYHENFVPGKEYMFKIRSATDNGGNFLICKDAYSFKISKNGEDIEANYIERKVFSIIGRSAEHFSLFSLLESFITKTTSNIIMSNQMQNLEYRLPLLEGEGFEYWSVKDQFSGKTSTKSVEIETDLKPNYLNVKNNIKISKPKGIHYTKINEMSERPYETSWDVEIDKTSFEISLENKRQDILLDGTEKTLSKNRTCQISFDFSITVSSGWGLDEVDYNKSNTFISDVVNFLKKAWNFIKDSISFLIDGIQKIMNLIENMVNYIKDNSERIIQLFGKVVRKVVVDLIRPRISDLTGLCSAGLGDFRHKFHLLGLTLLVDTYKEKTGLPNHQGKLYRFLNISLSGNIIGNSFDFNFNVLENDVVCFGKFSVGDLEADWQIDPLYNPETSRNEDPFFIYDSWFELQGETSGSYINLTSPVDTTVLDSYEISLGKYTPIDEAKIPIGPVVVTGVDLGLRFEYENLNQSRSIIAGMLDKVFRESIRAMEDTSFSYQYVIDFIQIFIKKFIDQVISFIQQFVKTMVIFFTACINGVDIELTFGINNEKAVYDFVLWMYKIIENAFADIIEKDLPSFDLNPPKSLFKSTSLGIESSLTENTSAYFMANIPALASVFDYDIGRWKITFGLVMPDFELISGTLVEK